MRRILLLGCTALAVPPALAQAPDARPQGGAVVAGQARITQTPDRTRVEQSSDRAILEWRSFDVGRDHRVEIQQPGAASWSLQRVTGGDPSVIAGRIASNGGVALVNPAGITVMGGAQVDVASLIATTADIANQAFMAGRMAFDGPSRPGARVENRGTITVRDEGLAALVGPVAANSGTIRARLGRTAILGAEAVTLDLAGDGLLAFDVTRQVQSGALALNAGSIAAEGGAVLISAPAASGALEALVAPNEARLAAGSTIAAQAVRVTGGAAVQEGGATIAAPGGHVALRGAQRVEMRGEIRAPGGRVEVSSPRALALDGRMEAARVVVDPAALHVVAALSGGTDPAEITAGAIAATTGDLVLEATDRIRVEAAIAKPMGGLTLRTTGAAAAGIHLGAPVATGGALALETAGLITQAAPVTAPLLSVQAGDAVLDHAGNRIAALGTVQAASLRLSTQTGLRLTGPLTAGQALLRVLGGGLTQDSPFAPVSVTSLALEVPSGSARLDGVGNGILFLSATARDALVLETTTPLLLTGPTGAAVVELRAQGDIAQDPGATLSAGLLRLLATGGGAVTLDDPANAVAVLGASAAAGGLTLAAGGNLSLEGRIVAPFLRLSARGGLAQSAEAAIEADFLSARALGGPVALDLAANAVSLLGPGGAEGEFRLASTLPLTLAGALDAGGRIAIAAPALAVEAPLVAPQVALLASAGDLTQGPAGGIATGALSARAPQGAVRLEAGANAIAALEALEAGGEARLATLTALALTGPGRAASLALSASGAIRQAPGAPITAARLDIASALGAVALGAGNAVEALGAVSAPGGFLLTTTTGLRLTEPLAAPSVALRAGGDIAQDAGAQLETQKPPAESLGGAVRLDATGNEVGGVSGRAAGLFRLHSTGSLTLDGPVTAPGGIALRAGGDIAQVANGAGLSAPRLDISAPFGSVMLEGMGNLVGELGLAEAAGRLALVQSGPAPLRLTGLVRGAEVALDAASGILQAGGAIRAGVLTLASAGDALLTGDNLLGSLGGARIGGVLHLASAGPLGLSGPVAAAALLLDAPGISQDATGAGITAGRLSLLSAAPVGLEGAGNAVAALGPVQAPELRLVQAGGLGASAPVAVGRLHLVSTGGAVELGTGHAIGTLSGGAATRFALGAAGDLALDGLAAPLVALDAGGSLTGSGLRAAEARLSGTEVNLAAGGNAVAALTSARAAGGFALATAGSLRVAGPVEARRLTLRAGDALVLDGAAITLAEAGLLAAPGGVLAGAPSSLRPRDPGLAPALVLDTRSLGALEALPGFVVPEGAGAATALAAFGAATPVVSGRVELALDAGASPVFLLMGTGRASGQLEAGRLGLLGGGGAALTGRLGGLEGGAAAGRMEAGAAGVYLFNACPAGTACLPVPPPQPPPLPPTGPVTLPETPAPGPVPARAPPVLPVLLTGATAPLTLPEGWWVRRREEEETAAAAE